MLCIRVHLAQVYAHSNLWAPILPGVLYYWKIAISGCDITDHFAELGQELLGHGHVTKEWPIKMMAVFFFLPQPISSLMKRVLNFMRTPNCCILLSGDCSGWRSCCVSIHDKLMLGTYKFTNYPLFRKSKKSHLIWKELRLKTWLKRLLYQYIKKLNDFVQNIGSQ